VKQTLKKLLPASIYNKLLHKYAFWKYTNKDILQKNKLFKSAGRGRRAFILATGPSIKQEDLASLKGEDCFSASNFFLHKDLSTISPRFHFFAPHHQPLTLESYIEWLSYADKKLPKSTGIILGHKTKEMIEKKRLFEQRKIFYLYLDPHIHSTKKIDLTKPILSPQTIIHMMLPVLIYMGYKKIYLLGCEHKWSHHFYDTSLDIRKCIPVKNNPYAGCTNFLMNTKELTRRYKLYKSIGKQKRYGTEIINLSESSPIIIFPFDDLQNIISHRKERGK